MFAVVGTIPDEDFPLTAGQASLSGDHLIIHDRAVEITRGTPALMAAALMACNFFQKEGPFIYLIGDTGRGIGSRKLYQFLTETLPSQQFNSLTFHYIQPDVDWHNKVLFAVDAMKPRPTLIADAGFMYAAKMSGQAESYDIFTPDIGELAFLADESAPHPFYTRGFILHKIDQTPELISRAYQYHNAARYLLVKGKQDIIANKEGIHEMIAEPMVPALEPIGGTGDIITGLLAALTDLGFELPAACRWASKISRMAGQMAQPDPGTPVLDIIRRIPESLKIFLKEKN